MGDLFRPGGAPDRARQRGRPRAGGAADRAAMGGNHLRARPPGGPGGEGGRSSGDSRSRSPTGFGWRRSCPDPPRHRGCDGGPARRSRRSGSPCPGALEWRGGHPSGAVRRRAPGPHNGGVRPRPPGLTLEGRVRAAVLVLSCPGRRAGAGLRQEDRGCPRHKGQFSFPGGVVQHSDRLGHRRGAARGPGGDRGRDCRCRGAGALDDVPRPSRTSSITPVLALARGEPTFRPDGREIERVIEIPLERLLRPDAFRVEDWERGRRAPAGRLRELRRGRGMGHHGTHPARAARRAVPGGLGGPGDRMSYATLLVETIAGVRHTDAEPRPKRGTRSIRR